MQIIQFNNSLFKYPAYLSHRGTEQIMSLLKNKKLAIKEINQLPSLSFF